MGPGVCGFVDFDDYLGAIRRLSNCRNRAKAQREPNRMSLHDGHLRRRMTALRLE
jgi:hypothetical protein